MSNLNLRMALHPILDRRPSRQWTVKLSEIHPRSTTLSVEEFKDTIKIDHMLLLVVSSESGWFNSKLTHAKMSMIWGLGNNRSCQLLSQIETPKINRWIRSRTCRGCRAGREGKSHLNIRHKAIREIRQLMTSKLLQFTIASVLTGMDW
jgi:hypothetical protein